MTERRSSNTMGNRSRQTAYDRKGQEARNPRSGGSSSKKSSSKNTNRGKYVTVSLIANAILGFLGIGIGFAFFLGSVLFYGSGIMQLVVFFGCAVAVFLYLLIVFWANRFWVLKCSNKKSRRMDKNRLFWSMLYVVCVFVVSFAYSFLRASISTGVAS